MSFQDIVRRLTKPASFSVAVALLVFAVACVFSLPKPLNTDEVEFHAAAQAITKTGKPIYYAGEWPAEYVTANDSWIYSATPSPNHQYGLWHTPLYLYMISVAQAVFGESDAATRLPGAILVVATFVLLASSIFGTAIVYLAPLIFFNPFITQMGLMVDYDNTIMTFASLLFLAEYVRVSRSGLTRARDAAWLSVLAALASWSKEYAPVYLLVAVTAYELLSGRLGRLGKAFVLFAIGLTGFALTYFAFCWLLDLPVDYVWRFSYVRRHAAGSGTIFQIARDQGLAAAWLSVKATSMFSVAWLSPFFALLGVATVSQRIARYVRTRNCEPVDLFILYAITVLAATKLARPSTASLKYEYPAYPALAGAMSLYLFERLGVPSLRACGIGLTALIGVALAQVTSTGDSVLLLKEHGPASAELRTAILSCVLLGGGVVAGAYSLTRRWPQAITAALAVLLMGSNLALSAAQLRPYTTSPSWLAMYGEANLEKVAQHIGQYVRVNDIIFARKDISYRIARQISEGERFRWIDASVLFISVGRSPAALGKLLSMRAPFIVFDKLTFHPKILGLLKDQYEIDRDFGSFLVLRQKRQWGSE